MSNFEPEYLQLLESQVIDEIEFLRRNSHDQEKISQPCMFCIESTNSDYYRCKRLQELRRFLASIMQHKAKGHRQCKMLASDTLQLNSSQPVLPLLYGNF